jgi:hypothetical protein
MENDLHNLAAGPAALSPHASLSDALRRGRGMPISARLEDLLTPQPESSYLFRVAGYAWAESGLVDGDIAVVNRALRPGQTDLVISWSGSGFAITKHYQLEHGDEPLGVVTAIIHPLQQT